MKEYTGNMEDDVAGAMELQRRRWGIKALVIVAVLSFILGCVLGSLFWYWILCY